MNDIIHYTNIDFTQFKKLNSYKNLYLIQLWKYIQIT